MSGKKEAVKKSTGFDSVSDETETINISKGSLIRSVTAGRVICLGLFAICEIRLLDKDGLALCKHQTYLPPYLRIEHKLEENEQLIGFYGVT